MPPPEDPRTRREGCRGRRRRSRSASPCGSTGHRHGFLLHGERQDRANARPRARGALDLELPAKLRHDRPADGQPQTVALGLGREEGLLDPGQLLAGSCRSRCLRPPVPGHRPRRRPGWSPGPPAPVASRALLIRFRRSCSTSAWTAKRGGRSAGNVDHQANPAPLQPLAKDRHRPVDGVVQRDLAGIAGPCPGRSWSIAAEDSPADLDGLLDLSGGRSTATEGSSRFSSISARKLLDQREHGAEGVVHVVGDAPREVGHRVLAFRGQHAQLERFGAMGVLQCHGRLGQELGDQLDLVRAERARVDRGNLQDAEQP